MQEASSKQNRPRNTTWESRAISVEREAKSVYPIRPRKKLAAAIRNTGSG
jgi:hypothetical protein